MTADRHIAKRCIISGLIFLAMPSHMYPTEYIDVNSHSVDALHAKTVSCIHI